MSMDQQAGQVRLGRVLADLMAERHFTDASLAKATGKSPQRIADYRLGRLARMEQVAVIEAALGCYRGEMLIRAGYVKVPDVVAATVGADELPEAAKQTILAIYETMRTSTDDGSSGGGGNSKP